MTAIAMADVAAPPPLPTPLPPDIALIQKRGVLKAAFDNDNVPPFYMHDAQNNWSGIDVDLAQMIAKQLGVKLVIVPAATYDDMVNMVFNGQADMALGLLNITPARELKISFTSPYYSFQRHMLVNVLQAAQNHWNIWDVVNQMETTNKPIKIGALGQGAALATLNEFFPHAIAVPYNSINQAMKDVVAGKIFAVITTSPLQTKMFLEDNPGAALAAEDVQISNWAALIAVGVPWQYYSFRIWLNAYFSYLQSNNIESQVFNKYISIQKEEINDAPAFY